MTSAFHLNNCEAKHELKVDISAKLLPFCHVPIYHGIKLDRTLTFRHLCIAALSLVYATAEYCASVWCRSVHTRLIGNVLNNALRIVTVYLRSTPADSLPILASIHPTDVGRFRSSMHKRVLISLVIANVVNKKKLQITSFLHVLHTKRT